MGAPVTALKILVLGGPPPPPHGPSMLTARRRPTTWRTAGRASEDSSDTRRVHILVHVLVLVAYSYVRMCNARLMRAQYEKVLYMTRLHVQCAYEDNTILSSFY